MELILPFHSRALARNIKLLRMSKEDYQADAKLWKSANCATDSFPDDADEVEPANFGSGDEENEEFFHLRDENFNADTFDRCLPLY